MQSGLQFQKTVTMIVEICCNCGIAFGLPSDLREHLMNDPNKWFYCPNGHRQHYCKSQEQRLREEVEAKLKETQRILDEKKRQLEDSDHVKAIMQKQLNRATNKLKRVYNGTCPCCKRHFKNLSRHMKTKHPEHAKKR